MNILVIGNGFDIAHGLPTQYPSFLKYIEAFKKVSSFSNGRQQINEDIMDYYLYFDHLKDYNSTLFTELKELIKDNKWIVYFCKKYH